jgi:Ribosomal protein L11 methyltransferase (PrmA)
MSLVLDEHREYLSDKLRLDLFRKAIKKTVKPGDVVMDLGAGSGILGLFACEAGARRVYAVDAGGMIQVARELARANGFGDRVMGIQGLSTRIDLPEKVDVIVADQIGHFGFEAGVLEFFRDAVGRFLKPGGRTVPRRISLHTGAVTYPRGYRNAIFWSMRPAGFDFSPAQKIASNTGYPTEARLLKLISNGAKLTTLDAAAAPADFSADVSVRVARKATMHGIAGWFSSELAQGVEMTNSPATARRITRRAVFLPIEHPVQVVPGDRVSIAMNITPEQIMVTWKVKITNKSGDEKARFIHSTMRGMLLTPENLAKTRPDFVPRLTPWGEARRTVVDLCDGERPLEEIEKLVFDKHRNLFDSLARAAEFVTEVTAVYAEPPGAAREISTELQQAAR